MMTMMNSYSWGSVIFWSVLLLVMIVLLVIAVAYLLWKVNHLSNQIVKLEERQRHLDH